MAPTTTDVRRPTATTLDDPLQTAVEDVDPLLPQLPKLGVTVVTIPGDTFPGAVTRDQGSGTIVLVLPQDVSDETAERLARYWIGTLYDYDNGRPLVVNRREGRDFRGPHLTFCPGGCREDHAIDIRGTALADIVHTIGEMTEMTMSVSNVEVPVLSGLISVDPYSDVPERAVPHVNLNVFGDHFMENLGPDELADVAAKLRAHADRLGGLRLALMAARDEWQPVQ
jgi:hypothetical protein